MPMIYNVRDWRETEADDDEEGGAAESGDEGGAWFSDGEDVTSSEDPDCCVAEQTMAEWFGPYGTFDELMEAATSMKVDLVEATEMELEPLFKAPLPLEKSEEGALPAGWSLSVLLSPRKEVWGVLLKGSSGVGARSFRDGKVGRCSCKEDC